MATNLRLRPDAENAVRQLASETGRSQQDLLREAVDRYVQLASSAPSLSTAAEVLVATQGVLPPRSPFRELDLRVTLPAGVHTSRLLDRDERW